MSDTPVQSLANLLSRYLERQALDQAEGLAGPLDSEVQPFEAAPVQAMDPRLAWSEALATSDFFGIDCAQSKAVPDWPTLVRAHEPVMALAMGIGNFPQLVRDLHKLLNAGDRVQLQPSTSCRVLPVPDLIAWSRQASSMAERMLALGSLRLAGQFTLARELAAHWQADVPPEWLDSWKNEQAVLDWQSGNCEEARRSWRQMSDSVAVYFNRGVSEVFGGDPESARANLQRAIDKIPESSAWHHLARLYLALVQPE